MSSIKSCPRFCVNIIFRSRALKSSFQCSLQRAIVQSWDLPWSALSCIESKFVEILGQKYQQRRKTWPNITKNEKKIGLKYIMERRRSCSHHNEPRRTSLRQKLCNRGNLWNQRNARAAEIFALGGFCVSSWFFEFFWCWCFVNFRVWWMGSHKAPGAEIERRKMTEFVFSQPGKESDT